MLFFHYAAMYRNSKRNTNNNNYKKRRRKRSDGKKAKKMCAELKRNLIYPSVCHTLENATTKNVSFEYNKI